MYNSKLYSILEHFTKYEQNRFRKYLQSPYFNKNDNLIQLYETLLSQINKIHAGKTQANGLLGKENIWKKMDLDKKYDDVRFRKFCSDLLKLVENFLSQQIYEEDSIQVASNLILAVGNKKLEKLYNSTMRTARRLSNQLPHRSASFYYHQYQIENSYYKLQEYDIKRTEISNVEEIIKNLDYFYLAEKLRLYCSILSRQKFLSREYQSNFINEVITIVEKNNFDAIPSVAVYYQIYLTQTFPQEENYYFKLKEILGKYSLSFPVEEGNMIYIYAINYCINKINRGQSKFLEELFSIYKAGIENKILFGKENVLEPWAFKNITVIALRLGHYKWTEQFIHEYIHMLPEAFQENAYTFSLAQVYFYQKQHERVIEQLQKVEYEDVAYNLDSKAMLLATYYETDEMDALYFLFESFRAYLNRHKDIPPQRRKNYANLIKFTKKLSKIMPGDQKAIEKLKEEVAATKNIASASWLRKKIAELEN